MKLGFDDHIVEIVELENKKHGNRYNIRSLKALAKEDFKNRVKDSAKIFRIDGVNPEDDSIIALSNVNFPDAVYEAVTKSEMVFNILEVDLGNHILLPSSTGRFENQSYAVWPRHKPFSSNRVLKRIQIRSVYKVIFQWSSDIQKFSRHSVKSDAEIECRYVEPLTFLNAQEFIPSGIKKISSASMAALEDGSFSPVSVVQHGDFWYGNMLLEKHWPLSKRSAVSFFVIDWGGANIHGYPFIDQLRYLMSVGMPDKAIAKFMIKYCNDCGLTMPDLLRYACTYAGQLGMNRGEFPLDRYLDSVVKLIRKASDLSVLSPEVQ